MPRKSIFVLVVSVLSLVGVGVWAQTRRDPTAVTAVPDVPDFSGKWTAIREKPDAPVETMTVTHRADTLTVEAPSPTGTLRWTFKLDGSENKNLTIQGNPPREVIDVSTATWEGSSLAFRSSNQSNKDGPYLIKSVWSVNGKNLVVQTTQTSQKDGAVQRDVKTVYSK